MDLANTPGYVAGFPFTMNLRELGGIKAADGRRVRHGLFYRGSALAGLTPEQKAIVDGMGLSLIFDLRAENEAAFAADYVPEGVAYRRVSGMYDEDGAEVDFSPAATMRRAEELAGNPFGFMHELYLSMAHGNPALHALVDALVAGNAPIYFHCGAGKDRTGVASALILSLLGVPDDELVADFLLTNAYRAELIENVPDQIPDVFMNSIPGGISLPVAHEIMREIWAHANGVVEEDLRNVLAAMDEGVSSREEYFEREYGLDAAALASLRDRYLE